MSRPIRELTIDVRRLDKAHFFEGKPRKDGSVPLYCTLAVFANKDGVDQYGQDAFVVQGVSKAAREAGQKGPTVGNSRTPQQQAPKPAATPPPSAPADDDSVPF